MTSMKTMNVLALALIAVSISACSRDQAPAASTTKTAATKDAAASTSAGIQAKKEKPTACAMVSAQEMSTILGTAVLAEPHEGSVDKTECIYKPADKVSPYVELTVEWGEGQDAMAAMGAMGHVAPGITDPYAGIGDQAAVVGTVLMVRTGADLVSITFSGVEDAPPKAKKIFNTAKAKM